MRGIVLAGGLGTRLMPTTLAVGKQLLPIYDKPTIYYPLCTLACAGVRDILFITRAEDRAATERLLGTGAQWGMNIEYALQHQPRGIADAFLIARDFVGSERCVLILGDNIFHGEGMAALLHSARERKEGATVFARRVPDPERYGVVSIADTGRATRIEEKPTAPQSDWAVTGLYFYDNAVLDIAAGLAPSARGELEITDVNAAYLERGQLCVERMENEIHWFDVGTNDSFLDASIWVRDCARRGECVGVVEAAALQQGWIGESELRAAARKLGKSSYGAALAQLLSAAPGSLNAPNSPDAAAALHS